jgi:hypothetical protein
MRWPTLRERLLSKAVINWESGCWEWTAQRDPYGYGAIKVNGSKRGSHRVAFELIEGPIATGLQLDHLCRVRHCINPAHLEPVTPRENTMRGVAPSAVNAAKTRCGHGHEFTPENTYTTPLGGRACRACQRATVARYRRRQRAEGADAR